MRNYPTNRFVPGAKKATCARCSFDFLNTELLYEESTGYMVCRPCYDPIDPYYLRKKQGVNGAGERTFPTDQIYSEEN